MPVPASPTALHPPRPPEPPPQASPPPLHGDDVAAFAGRAVAPCPRPPGALPRLGVEAEWFVHDAADPGRTVALTELPDGLVGSTLPAGSRVTVEPGGQLEVSGPCLPVAAAVAALTADVALVAGLLAPLGLALHGAGLDDRPPVQQLATPRYAAMRAAFAACDAARGGPEPGRTMMCRTASLQLNVDAGTTPGQVRRRWHRAHLVGPLLVALSAGGRPSPRWQVWQRLDPARTRPTHDIATPDADPAAEWERQLLTTPVLLVREGDECHAGSGFTLADWLARPELAGRPATLADLELHATTLFPPVRPRGWLELRPADAVPAAHLPGLAAVGTALVETDTGAVEDALTPTAGDGATPWVDAARRGLAEPALRGALRQLTGPLLATLQDAAPDLLPAAAGFVADALEGAA